MFCGVFHGGGGAQDSRGELDTGITVGVGSGEGSAAHPDWETTGGDAGIDAQGAENSGIGAQDAGAEGKNGLGGRRGFGDALASC